MSIISIIGTGNMARTIGALAVAGGNTVEVIGRDQSKAADLAKTLGGSTTTGEFGAVPAGDIVIVALALRQCRSGRRPVRKRPRGQGHRRHLQPRQFRGRRARHPRWHLDRAGSRRGGPGQRQRGEGIQHHLRCCPGQGPAAGRLHRRRRRARQGGRGRIRQDPQAAPARRRRLEHGALPGRNGPGHDRSCPTRGGELRLRPRCHRAQLSRTAAGPSRARTGAPCPQNRG